MRKLAEFIVDKRRVIIALSLVLAVLGALATTMVTVNKDLTRYLPEQSQTLRGMDAMNEEFAESTPIRVMFEYLTDEEVAQIETDLANLSDVYSVSVTRGEEGTPSEDKTLYDINLRGGTYSESASNGLAQVRAYADEHDLDLYVSGMVVDSEQLLDTLAVTIVLAVGLGLFILFVMCSSWVEPLLFLLTIVIAILLNMGTNVIFDSVSQTTFSIAAVLQLALSMDYSIMLTDRYRQQRLVEADKSRAMVNALTTGFTAISSSSITTIAGMICLVVMSFTIGRDMGLVLAKGVAFSVLCVLFVLPGLMVACDTGIQKTRKPYPKPKLRGLARFSNALRFVILLLFIVLMAASFVVKNSTTITFFMDSSNKDAEVIDAAFAPTERVVVLYEAADEKTAAAAEDALRQIGRLNGIADVKSFGSTVGKTYTSDGMADYLGMDDAVVQLFYYTYANGTDGSEPRSVNEFARFILDEVVGSESFGSSIDEGMSSDVERLANLSDAAALERQRTAADAAAVLGTDAEQMGQVYVSYRIDQGDTSTDPVPLGEFISFLAHDVAADETYGALLDDGMREQVDRLAVLADPQVATVPLGSAGLAGALGMDESQVVQILSYQTLATADMSGYYITLPRLFSTLVDEMANSPAYAAYFDDETRARLEQLRAVVDASAAGAELSAAETASIMGLDEATVSQLFALSASTKGLSEAPRTMTMPAFLGFLVDGLLGDPYILAALGPELSEQFQSQAPGLVYLRNTADTAAAGVAMNPDEMAYFTGFDPTMLRQVYLLSGIDDGTFPLPQMSVQEFLAYILDDLMQIPEFQSMVDEQTAAQLYQARTVVDTAVAGTPLDPYGIAEVLGIDPAQVEQLLTLRAYLNGGSDTWTLSLAQTVPYLAGLVDETDPQHDQLQMAADVVEGTLAGAVYTADQMADLLGSASEGFSASTVTLLYLLADALAAQDGETGGPGAQGEAAGGSGAQTITLEQFVTYVADDVTTDPLFADVIDDEAKSDLVDAKETIVDSKGEFVGATLDRAIYEVYFSRSSDEMSDFVYQVRDLMDQSGATYYLVGDGPMGVEMREMFVDEFNFITLLTAVVIFLIVAITFRSAVVSLVLVLLIQTAINLTMGLTALQGIGVYYIALMIVQALLMGATIDYAILFTTFYRDSRATLGRADALARSFEGSVGTIMTSSSILILVLLVVGLTSSDVTISEVCLTISKGSLVAVILVMLLLPGILAALDRFTAGPGALRPNTPPPVPPAGPGSGYGNATPERPSGRPAEQPAARGRQAQRAGAAWEGVAWEDVTGKPHRQNRDADAQNQSASDGAGQQH